MRDFLSLNGLNEGYSYSSFIQIYAKSILFNCSTIVGISTEFLQTCSADLRDRSIFLSKHVSEPLATHVQSSNFGDTSSRNNTLMRVLSSGTAYDFAAIQ